MSDPDHGGVGAGCEPHDICAVVVTYHPDAGLAERIDRVAAQVARIVVVDNGSGSATVDTLRALAPTSPIDVIANAENRGVATALNQGVERARAAGFEWVLLLDQDTVVMERMTSTQCRALRQHPAPERVAIVGSNYIETANGRQLIPASAAPSTPWMERRAAITSGSLLSVRAFEAVGRFRDELFIDEVDTEFCLRARARGFQVIVTTEVTMAHTVGAAHRERRFLWRTVRPVNYSPSRWYYISRNMIVTGLEFWRTDPGWVAANLYGHAKWLAKALLYESDRLAKLRRTTMGISDAIRGRLGPRAHRSGIGPSEQALSPAQDHGPVFRGDQPGK